MTASELQFFTLTSAAEIEAIADQWDELVRLSSCNRTFSSLAWNLEAARLPAASSPFVIAGWRAGRLAAIFPLSLATTGVTGCEAVALCSIADYNDIVPDHRDPKGMGGAWRDDHPDNIQATHWWCNGEKGSTRIDD